MVEQLVFFDPASTQPAVKCSVVVRGDGPDIETTPVHVYGLRGFSAEVGGLDGEDLRGVLACWDAFVGDGAVVDVGDGFAELLDAELEALAAGEQLVLHVRCPVLVRPFLAPFACYRVQVCAFREEHQPHWRQGVLVKLLEMLGETVFVLFPVAFEEYEL